jgi:hypothetical protein
MRLDTRVAPEGLKARYIAEMDRTSPTVARKLQAYLDTLDLVPEGEALLTLLLGNLEHFINHKYQLFAHLKMLGVPLGSRDLYVFRGR